MRAKKLLFYLLICLPALIGGLFHKIYSLTKKNKKDKYNNVIVFQLGHLGDLVLTEPLLRNLKENNNAGKVTLVVGSWNHDLAKNIPAVDEVLIFDSLLYRRRDKSSFANFLKDLFVFLSKVYAAKYDLGIDLRGHINSLYLLYLSNIKNIIGFNYVGHGIFLQHKRKLDETLYEKDRLLSMLDLIKYKLLNSELKYNLSEEKCVKATDYLKSQGYDSKDKLIAVFPGAPYNPRRWPAESYALLADKIIDEKIGQVIILGGIQDKPSVKKMTSCMKNRPIQWIGNDINMLAGLIKKCNAFVGNDTGPMHLAVALDIPTIALFGPGKYKRWAPKPPHIFIRADVSCSPCDLNNDICTHPKVKCMDEIKVDDVKNALLSKVFKNG